MRIDLHAHSSVSDGTEPPADVVRRAAAAGLDVLALTDHDTVAGVPEATAALPAGTTLVPGMELSCLHEGASVHLLAYLFSADHPELAAELRRIRDDRAVRARTMVERLQTAGVEVAWERVRALAGVPDTPAAGETGQAGGAGSSVVGRPHIAQAIVEAGAAADVPEAFDRWIGAGRPGYVARYALDALRAVELVRAAGGVCAVAHPARGESAPDGAVPMRLIEEMAEAGLGGVEADHPAHDDDEAAYWRGAAKRLELAVTGSSDDHGDLTGHRLGCRTTAFEEYARLTEPATGSAPVTAE
ncbi:PHP domain-containing protein [Streptomonospora salina]|uniref:Putative metal-dependent phosphoesterase TrpH n=1 Tax=Streptomonospora salina TaxID=104205 RepID=A0A841E920_9ACTN|nr:PHP domain-containing protein [Streptomonospora salina]MBB5999496.1 putative metal-dependent phosphoesterase TrpH [Streptomonospora salina]